MTATNTHLVYSNISNVSHNAKFGNTILSRGRCKLSLERAHTCRHHRQMVFDCFSLFSHLFFKFIMFFLSFFFYFVVEMENSSC